MANHRKIMLQHLQVTSWRQLLAIMGNYHFSTSTRQIKESVIQHLHQHLTNVDTFTTIVAQLDEDAKDALRGLLAADGALPVHRFEYS